MKWIVVLLTLFCPCQGSGCPKDFISSRDIDRCYYVSDNMATYKFAFEDCKSRNSQLAPVLTYGGQVDLSSFLFNQQEKCSGNQNCMEFWIDVSRENPRDYWNSARLDLRPSYWARGFPQGDGNCVFMSFRDNIKLGTWKNENCNIQKKYVCIACPNGFAYAPLSNTCIYLNTKKMDWNEARLACTTLKSGAQLLAIEDEPEIRALESYLFYIYTPYDKPMFRECVFPKEGYSDEMNMVWTVGQTKDPKRCDTPFVWKPIGLKEKSFTYTHWGPGNPNCDANGEFCVRMVYGGQFSYSFDVASCSLKMCSICEFQ